MLELGKLALYLLGDDTDYQAMITRAMAGTERFVLHAVRSLRAVTLLSNRLGGGHIFSGTVGAAAGLEQMQVQFGTLAQSMEAGAQLTQQLQQLSATSLGGIGLTNLAKASQTLMQFGVAANSVGGTLRMLADITGGDNERFQRMALAFGQMRTEGRLTGQDLHQMINAGFNPLQEIATRTGRSMAELRGIMRTGGISSDVVTNAFRLATMEGGRFHNLMERMAGTVTGAFNQLTGAVGLFFTNIGTIFNSSVNLSGILQLLTTVVNGVSRAFNALPQWLKQGIVLLGAMVVAATTFFFLWPMIGPIIIGVLSGIAAAFGFLMTPLGQLAIIGVMCWDQIKAAATAFWNWVRPIAMEIGNIFAAVWQFVAMSASAMWETLVILFSKLGEFIGSVWSSVVSTTGLTWIGIRNTILEALIVVEWTMRNLGSVIQLSWYMGLAAAIQFANQVSYFFTTMIPTALNWFATNWQDIFKDIFNFTGTIFNDLGANIVRVFQNMPALIAGMPWSEVWRPLGETFVRTTAELVIPDRVVGEYEGQINTMVEGLTSSLGNSFASFRQARIASLLGPQAAAERTAAENLGLNIGGAMANKARYGVEKLNAMLWNSAEAITAIAHYVDTLAGIPQVRSRGGAPPSARLGAASNVATLANATTGIAAINAATIGALPGGAPAPGGAFTNTVASGSPVAGASLSATAPAPGGGTTGGDAVSLLRSIDGTLRMISTRLGAAPVIIPAGIGGVGGGA